MMRGLIQAAANMQLAYCNTYAEKELKDQRAG